VAILFTLAVDRRSVAINELRIRVMFDPAPRSIRDSVRETLIDAGFAPSEAPALI
jgi:hypothetical protein